MLTNPKSTKRELITEKTQTDPEAEKNKLEQELRKLTAKLEEKTLAA